MNQLITALAGCGKTTELLKRADQSNHEGKNVLYIAFNRALRAQAIRRSTLTETTAHTVHSLAFLDCIRAGMVDALLEPFAAQIKKEVRELVSADRRSSIVSISDLKKPELSEFFQNLILWWIESAETQFRDIDVLILDEIQDLSMPLIKLTQKLIEANAHRNVQVIAAGDPMQEIYSFLNKDTSASFFERFGNFFGESEHISLTTPHRSTYPILRFVNSFLALQGSEMAYNLSEPSRSDKIGDVKIHAMQNWEAVIAEIRALVQIYCGKKVLILGHTHHQLDQLEAEFKDDENIRVSSIHSAKGGESEVVIISHSMFGDKLSQMTKNVWYVAFTRASQRLHIVSSFPLKNLATIFGKPGAYTLINKQAKVSSSRMKPLDEAMHTLTFEQACRSTIDSVDVRIPYTACPFVPYEADDAKPKEDENGQKIKRSKYVKKTIKELRGLKFALTRHNGKYLTFEFHDLNSLKGRGMSDHEIMTFIIGIIKEYFAYQISDEKISELVITRLDLCRLVRTADTSILDIFSLVYRFSRYVDAKEKTKVKPGENGSMTVYLNACRSKNRPIRTLRAYAPTDKAINAMNDSNCVIKLEVEKHRSEGIGDCHLDMRMNELLSLARKKALSELYASWLRYEFPILSEPNQNMGRRPFSSQDEIMREVSVALKSRDKRPLFYAFLNQLPEDIADAIRTLLCISRPSDEITAQDSGSGSTFASEGFPGNSANTSCISTAGDKRRKKETGKKPRGKELKRNAPKGVYINAPKSKARSMSGCKTADRTVSSGLKRSIPEKR